MLAFFIALIGGAFWICKIGYERHKDREADIKIARAHAQYDQWRNSIIDCEVNKYTMDMVKTKRGFQKLQAEAIEIIRQMPGMENAKMFGELSDSARDAVRYIAMVKRGKLPHGDCDSIPLSMWQCTDINFTKHSMVEFARWVESTIRANGHPEARLYYSKKLSGAVNDYERGAVFMWEPALIDFDDAYSVSHEDLEQIMIGSDS